MHFHNKHISCESSKYVKENIQEWQNLREKVENMRTDYKTDTHSADVFSQQLGRMTSK